MADFWFYFREATTTKGLRLNGWKVMLIAWLAGVAMSASSEVGKPRVGEIAPGFMLPVLAGRSIVALEDYQGKVVYLDFWNSRCAPCRDAMPIMGALRNRLSREGFEVIAVNTDRYADDARRFLASVPVDFPVVSDAAQTVGDAYGVSILPTSFLLDRRGIVRSIHQGWGVDDLDDIAGEIEDLLEQKAAPLLEQSPADEVHLNN